MDGQIIVAMISTLILAIGVIFYLKIPKHSH
jgi:hypothetical protein